MGFSVHLNIQSSFYKPKLPMLDIEENIHELFSSIIIFMVTPLHNFDLASMATSYPPRPKNPMTPDSMPKQKFMATRIITTNPS